jgi:hypothetical protein
VRIAQRLARIWSLGTFSKSAVGYPTNTRSLSGVFICGNVVLNAAKCVLGPLAGYCDYLSKPYNLITQLRVVILYRRFGTTYRSHLLGSRCQKRRRNPFKMGPIRCPETSVKNYQSIVRNIAEYVDKANYCFIAQ